MNRFRISLCICLFVGLLASGSPAAGAGQAPDALTISGVSTSATPESFVVTWTTNQPATSRLDWGTSPTALTSNAVDGSLTTVHSMTITGLTPGTTYWIEITSVNNQGGVAKQTLGGPAKPEPAAPSPAVVPAPVAPAPRGMADVILCSSKPGERIHCDADSSAGVVLLRSTGDSACLLGRNWGYDNQGIWVSDGCSGEFGIGSTKETSLVKDFVGMFEPYGSLRGHVAIFNDQAEVQDNASRVGIRFATRGAIKIFAGTEWGVNLVRSENQFNADANNPGGFSTIYQTSNPVFTARLGYLGVDFGPIGKVSVGKQNSVHYDITGYTTDQLNVFGGQASATYVGGTDGGVTASGRADQVVQYRNNFLKILDVAGQVQFRSNDTGHTADSLAASAQVTVFPGVKVGAAYTKTYWADGFKFDVPGLGGDAEYIAFGSSVNWRYLQLGATFVRQHNGDIVYIPLSQPDSLPQAVGFDADGMELFGRVRLGHFAIVGGYNDYRPEVRSVLIDPNFRTRYFVAGGEWYVARSAWAYCEAKLDWDSIGPTGAPGFNVYTIGFRYEFSWRTSHRP